MNCIVFIYFILNGKTTLVQLVLGQESHLAATTKKTAGESAPIEILEMGETWGNPHSSHDVHSHVIS